MEIGATNERIGNYGAQKQPINILLAIKKYDQINHIFHWNVCLPPSCFRSQRYLFRLVRPNHANLELVTAIVELYLRFKKNGFALCIYIPMDVQINLNLESTTRTPQKQRTNFSNIGIIDFSGFTRNQNVVPT